MEQPQPFRKKKRISDKNLSLSRKIRGYAILAKGDMPIAVSKEEFLIPSQSSLIISEKVNYSKFSISKVAKTGLFFQSKDKDNMCYSVPISEFIQVSNNDSLERVFIKILSY